MDPAERAIGHDENHVPLPSLMDDGPDDGRNVRYVPGREPPPPQVLQAPVVARLPSFGWGPLFCLQGPPTTEPGPAGVPVDRNPVREA